MAPGNGHVYYVHALTYDKPALGIPRAAFVEAVNVELPATGLRAGGKKDANGGVPPMP